MPSCVPSGASAGSGALSATSPWSTPGGLCCSGRTPPGSVLRLRPGGRADGPAEPERRRGTCCPFLLPVFFQPKGPVSQWFELTVGGRVVRTRHGCAMTPRWRADLCSRGSRAVGPLAGGGRGGVVAPPGPHKRVDALPSSRHVVVRPGGDVLADSVHPVVLFETGLPSRFYLPREDVRLDVLVPGSSESHCPYRDSPRLLGPPDRRRERRCHRGDRLVLRRPLSGGQRDRGPCGVLRRVGRRRGHRRAQRATADGVQRRVQPTQDCLRSANAREQCLNRRSPTYRCDAAADLYP